MDDIIVERSWSREYKMDQVVLQVDLNSMVLFVIEVAALNNLLGTFKPDTPSC